MLPPGTKPQRANRQRTGAHRLEPAGAQASGLGRIKALSPPASTSFLHVCVTHDSRYVYIFIRILYKYNYHFHVYNAIHLPVAPDQSSSPAPRSLAGHASGQIRGQARQGRLNREHWNQISDFSWLIFRIAGVYLPHIMLV